MCISCVYRVVMRQSHSAAWWPVETDTMFAIISICWSLPTWRDVTSHHQVPACHAAPRHVAPPRSSMSCHVTPSRHIGRRQHGMSRHIAPLGHVTPHRITSHHQTPACHVASRCVTSRRATLRHITPRHVFSHHNDFSQNKITFYRTQ